VVEEGMDR